MKRIPQIECLEDRFAPALAVAYINKDWVSMGAGEQIADADPWTPGDQAVTIGTNGFAAIDAPQAGKLVVLRGNQPITSDAQLGAASVVAVYSPGSIEIVGDVTTSRTIHLNANSAMRVNGTLTFSGEIDGGYLAGPGTIDIVGPSSINGSRMTTSVTVNANADTSFNGCDNGGKLTLAAGHLFTLSQFTNTPGGRLFVNGTANATDFVSNGKAMVSGTLANVGTSGLTFGGGSVTMVNRIGPADFVNDGLINLGVADLNLTGGLLVNHGFVGSVANVNLVAGVGSLIKGSGIFGSVLTENGGRFSPGGSPNTMAIIGGDLGGFVTTSNVIATGSLTVADPDFGESHFQAGGATTLYGSFTVNAAGQWTYTLDPFRPELILALAHASEINDECSVFAADGTEIVLSVRITV